jgi:hypothetical protein
MPRGHEATNSAEQNALTPVHRPVEPEPFVVGLMWEAQQALERVRRYKRVGTPRQCLLDFFCDCHGSNTCHASHQPAQSCAACHTISFLVGRL